MSVLLCEERGASAVLDAVKKAKLLDVDLKAVRQRVGSDPDGSLGDRGARSARWNIRSR